MYSTGAIADRTGLSLSTIKGWARQGRLPAPIVLAGSGRRAWRASDLDAIDRAAQTAQRRRRTPKEAPA
jgi:DNA-binding transcriptional MerR regulator